MSRDFLPRNNPLFVDRSKEEPTQKKIDPIAQLKWFEKESKLPAWNAFDFNNQSQPAQLFTNEEEEQVQGKAKEEELQVKPEEEELQMKVEEEELQMKSSQPIGGSTSAGAGTQTTMPDDVQTKMENSLGASFRGVNIHQNSAQAKNIGALAYTQGNNVHFAPGQYNPGSQKGQELLGHELTHVVQQRQGRVQVTTQGKGMPINDNLSLEKEADIMGAKAAQGKMANFSGKGSGIQRKEIVDSEIDTDQRILNSTPENVSLTDSNFWKKVNIGYYRDNGLLYVVANANSRISPIERNDEELFEETATRSSRNNNFDVVVNGNMYGVTRSGIADAIIGHDPIPAEETTPEGNVISGGNTIAGTNEPNMFYFAQVNNTENPFRFGFGNPPSNATAAMGGLGPVIINGLRYGNTNEYSQGVPEGAPRTGEPSEEHRQYLTQRSNLTYSAMQNRDPQTGKNIFAYSSSRKKIMILIQPHRSINMPLNILRDNLYNLGFDNAVFLDGSDSVMLMINNEIKVQQAEDKDETNTIGLGFNLN